MKKKITLILMSAILLMLLCSCPTPPGVMGGRLLMLGDHFMFDQTYDRGYQILHLNADGSYERIGRYWDTAAGKYVQEWGTKGTYTYDNKTCLLTIFPTHGWEWGDEVGAYADIAALYDTEAPEISSWTMTRTFTYYFTDNGMYDAYMAQPDGSWMFSEKFSSKETEGGTETEYYDDTRRTYTLSSSELKYEDIYVKKYREDTAETNQDRYREAGKVRRMAPTDVEWKAGKTVTFYYGPETRIDESWNDTTEEWDLNWEDPKPEDTWTRTFVHLGDFILKVDPASSKELIIE